MRLLEVIATPETDPAAMAAIADFADRQLGKTVVPANDVANFIANRVGTFVMLNTFKIMQEQGLSMEEIDVLTGPAVGWPKTGTFRLADLVGLDVLASVARNFSKAATDERSDVQLPDLIEQLIARKWLGDKTKQGFYKKERGADGKEVRSVLNLETLEYQPASKPSFPTVDLAKNNDSLSGRLKCAAGGRPGKGSCRKVLLAGASGSLGLFGEPHWGGHGNDRGYRSRDHLRLQLGAGTICALGCCRGSRNTVEKMRAAGAAIPRRSKSFSHPAVTSWYRAGGTEYFDVKAGCLPACSPESGTSLSGQLQATNGMFAGNSGISLVDVGRWNRLLRIPFQDEFAGRRHRFVPPEETAAGQRRGAQL